MTQEILTAATKGDTTRVTQLLKSDPTLAKAKDEKGLSVILKATYHGKKDIVAALLATGVELDIFEAAATGQTTQVLRVLKENSALVNAYSVDGFMPLGLAVFFGHREAVDALLAAGADVNAPSKESMKVTPLASATAARQFEIAKVLIARGANVNAKAENNLTPLHEAAAGGQLDLATLLLQQGADLNAKTNDGKTPLAYAVERNRTEMIALLKKKGAKE